MRKPTSFLDLPGELRNTIYSLALPSDHVFLISKRDHIQNALKFTQSGLLAIEGKVGQEANSYYLSFTTFSIGPDSIDLVLDFLHKLGL